MPMCSRLTMEESNALYADALRSNNSKALREFVLNDLFFLLSIACKRRDMVHPWLYGRTREVEAAPDGHLDLWPREFYKSTIGTFGKTLQDILNDPEITIGIFSHTRPIAKNFLVQISRELEINTFLQDLFPDVLYKDPSKESPRWSLDGGIIVRRKGNPKEPTVSAYGLVDGQPTSQHFNLMVYDDICTRESVTSPEMIEKTTDGWALSLNLGADRTNDDGTVTPCRKRYYGTRYHHQDTYKTILDREAAKPRIHYPTMLGQRDIDVVGVPVFRPLEVLITKRKEMGLYIYGAQMLQDPTADKAAGFDIDWLMYYHEFNRNKGMFNYYLLVDPAGEKKKGSDYTVIVVLALGNDNNYYLVDGIRDRLNLTERTKAVFELHRKWPIGNHVGYEKYGKDSDNEHIEYVQEIENYRFNITPLAGAMPKNDRIRRLVPAFEQHRFYMPHRLLYRTVDGRERDFIAELINEEYVTFPMGSHDDMCLVGETIIKTDRGDVPIKDVVIGDMVLTRQGYQRVIDCACTGEKEVITSLGIKGTGNHPVITKGGVKRLDSIHVDDMLYIWNEKLSSIQEKSITDIQHLPTGSIGCISGGTINGRLARSLYIDKSTLTILEQFQKDLSFITKMRTRLTMILQTLKHCLSPNMRDFIQVSPLGLSNKENSQAGYFIQKKTNRRQEIGTTAQKERRGTSNTQVNADTSLTVKVYNLTVENNNEYFANNILVHNCDCISRICDEEMNAVFPKLKAPEENRMHEKEYDPVAIPNS